MMFQNEVERLQSIALWTFLATSFRLVLTSLVPERMLRIAKQGRKAWSSSFWVVGLELGDHLRIVVSVTFFAWWLRHW